MRCLLPALFIVFTKLPFDWKLKLLPNLCNNSKIFKNKSCSKKSSTTLILKPPPNSVYILKCKFEFKNETFKELRLFKVLQFFLNNFENSKNQLCTTRQALHFCFKAQPQNVLCFLNGFFGSKLIVGNQSFRNFKSKPEFELNSNHTRQHS